MRAGIDQLPVLVQDGSVTKITERVRSAAWHRHASFDVVGFVAPNLGEASCIKRFARHFFQLAGNDTARSGDHTQWRSHLGGAEDRLLAPADLGEVAAELSTGDGAEPPPQLTAHSFRTPLRRFF